MKKSLFSIAIILALLLTFTSFPAFGVVASASSMECAPARLIKEVESVRQLSSRAGYLMDADSGTVMIEHNARERYPIASMVKIMTLLLCFESIERGEMTLTEQVVISENASGMGGSQMFLDTGLEYTISDLLCGAVIVSANDACVALAERVAGDEYSFVQQMNRRAAELQMNDTYYSNCTGLNIGEEQYSCAADCARVYRELIRHEAYFNYSKTWLMDYKHPDGRTTTFTNTNKLIRFYQGNEGGKTGYTSDSLFCLTTSAIRKDMHIIAVIIGAENSKVRFAEATNLLNYAFYAYDRCVLMEKKPLEETISVSGGRLPYIEAQPAREIAVLTKKGEKTDVAVNTVIFDNLRAPIAEGAEVGYVEVLVNGECVDRVPLVSTHNVEKQTYGDIVRKLIGAGI